MRRRDKEGTVMDEQEETDSGFIQSSEEDLSRENLIVWSSSRSCITAVLYIFQDVSGGSLSSC